MLKIRKTLCYTQSRFTDILLIRTPHYYGQFALSLGKESPYILPKFPLNTDTSSSELLFQTKAPGTEDVFFMLLVPAYRRTDRDPYVADE